MPTIAIVRGWRLFFYSNERNEPMHVHARKAGTECKYWIRKESFEIELAFEYGLSPSMRNEVRRVIFQQFDEIVRVWENHFREHDVD